MSQPPDGPSQDDGAQSEPQGPPPGYQPPRPPAEVPRHAEVPSDQSASHASPPPPPSGPGRDQTHTRPAGASARDEHPDIARAPDMKLPAFLGPLTARHVLTVVLSLGVAYLTLLVIAVLTVVGLLIGAALDGGSGAGQEVEMVAEEMNLSGVVALLTLPFQVVGVWLFGSFRFTMTIPPEFSQFLGGDSSVQLVSIFAPNLLVIVLAVGLAAWLGRRWSRRGDGVALKQLPALVKVTVISVVSFGAALLTVLLSWALSFRGSIEEGGQSIRMVGTAAGVELFFGALLVYAVIGVLLCIRRGTVSGVAKRVDYVLPSATRVPRVAATHALVVVVPALVLATIMIGIEGGVLGVLTFFFWASTAAVASFVLLNFGAVSGGMGMSGMGQQFAESETVYLWTADVSWVVIVLGLLLAVVAVAAASVVWSLVRDSRESTLRNVLSWITLPLAYAVIGAFLTFFGQIRLDLDMMGLGGGDLTIGPAGWTFVILLIVGGVIEVLSRFAAPLVTRRIPAGTARRIRGVKA